MLTDFLTTVARSAAAELSKNPRGQVAAVLYRDRRILSVGVNGTPIGWPNSCPRCTEPGTARAKKVYCLCVHAEVNAVMNAAREGVAVAGSECLVTIAPCKDCLRFLWQAGVRTVFYLEDHEPSDPSERAARRMTVDLFRTSGGRCDRVDGRPVPDGLRPAR